MRNVLNIAITEMVYREGHSTNDTDNTCPSKGNIQKLITLSASLSLVMSFFRRWICVGQRGVPLVGTASGHHSRSVLLGICESI